MPNRKRKERSTGMDSPTGDALELPDAGLFSALEDLINTQQQYFADDIIQDEYPSVQEFERELLALPADVGFSVAYHRMYPRLVHAHFDIRRLQEKDSKLTGPGTPQSMLEIKRENVTNQLWKLTSSEEGHQMQQHVSNDHFLNEFMYKYCMIVDSLHRELQKLYFELEASCQNFLREMSQLCEESRLIANVAPKRKKNCWNAEKRDDMKSNLRVKFAGAIKVLKKEFQARQKKGKLPSNATDLLKYWWEKNFHWPYPSEKDKKYFLTETKLTQTQINNWFINQRKRHWHKLFPNGIPSNPEESIAALRERGILSYSPDEIACVPYNLSTSG